MKYDQHFENNNNNNNNNKINAQKPNGFFANSFMKIVGSLRF
jgi:hypothetical protein